MTKFKTLKDLRASLTHLGLAAKLACENQELEKFSLYFKEQENKLKALESDISIEFLKELTAEQLQQLDFRYSKPDDMWLIPLWIFYYLPAEMEVVESIYVHSEVDNVIKLTRHVRTMKTDRVYSCYLESRVQFGLDGKEYGKGEP